jgi:hypothetical protein
MNANEIIVHREQRNRMRVVFNLLREAICQSGKAAGSAAEMGDQAWRQLLDNHDQIAKQLVEQHPSCDILAEHSCHTLRQALIITLGLSLHGAITWPAK